MNKSVFISRIHEFEYILTQSIYLWLNDILPQIADNWWNDLVLENLSFLQNRAIEDKNIETLSGLDLAALLKIVDRNWFAINDLYFLNNKNRYLIKEMQKVRNDWAHISLEDVSKDKFIKDSNLIKDLLFFFEASKNDIGVIDDYLSEINFIKDENFNVRKNENKNVVAQTDEISVGSIVSLVKDSNQIGAVIAITGSKYTVLINNVIQEFYKEQIVKRIVTSTDERISIETLKCILTANQILNTGSDYLYSLNSARIDFVPYQFRPALKLIQSDIPRILIADDVGVGKTIEAGLIIKELEARSELKSVLIICPRALVVEHKWKNEMQRFDEDFVELDNTLLRQCITETKFDGYWPDRYRKAIVSYSSLNENMIYGDIQTGGTFIGLSNLESLPSFDLIIVDEAHHIRNSSTLMHVGVDLLCKEAKSVVFLTATPLQNSSNDLFNLLKVLRPDIIYNQNNFQEMLEPNKYINSMLRVIRNQDKEWNKEGYEYLNKALSTSYGNEVLRNNPNLKNIYTMLSKDVISRNDKIQLINQVEQLHTFNSIVNRTRRKDIDNFCVRRTETIKCNFTKEQQNLYDRLLEFESIALSNLHTTNNIKFMMCTLMRQASSCIFGLAPYLKDIVNRRLDEVMYDGELYENELDIDLTTIETLKSLSNDIYSLTQNIPEMDPKFELLYKVIEEKYEEENNKIIIFSSFRHTLNYLNKKLKEYGVRCGMIDGSLKDDVRRSESQRFKLNKHDTNALDVLLFSEVGCEGLDYQFCDTMINYDLPWNPMRIEQRIGRIDRRGQKNEVVKIYNLITSNTIDASIYYRCLSKIGVFENSIGDCEEILGHITSEISNIMFDRTLTVDEINYKLDKLADNDILKIEEIRKLENDEKNLFGFDLKQYVYNQNIQQAENLWIMPERLEVLINKYLNNKFGDGEFIQGKNNIKNLRLSSDKKVQLLKELKKNVISTTRVTKE